MKISGGGGSDKQERGSETIESERENEWVDIGSAQQQKSETSVCAVNNTAEINKACVTQSISTPLQRLAM